MKNIAFIFARGGSKGLPGKNIRPLNGKPLIQYSIETAKQCISISEVYVSTDDAAIADVASTCGARVILRPKELASDTAPEWLGWQHAVQYVCEVEGIEDFRFVSLPCTSPLRSSADVEQAINKAQHEGVDVCISITPANRSPYFNMVTQNTSGELAIVIAPEQGVARRQDAPEVFDITTVVYVTSSKFVLEQRGIFSGKVHAVEVPKERAVDIDDIYDFMLAEAILAKKVEYGA
ncbi:cytidylyltransferase domain-containing protein [Marinagarivorans algicola]|uniref:acylneuraminate cytidylyltransferase family protein n=1 Tax=Marinagarivorans algicola TaxID=1513270 RepID=UPI0006B96B37|nr:acylneuraminate cytidylyltransferase family protein [Marinagarivorans algicola]